MHVYLDPADPPEEVMIQFNSGDWKHRALWGEDKGTRDGRPLAGVASDRVRRLNVFSGVGAAEVARLARVGADVECAAGIHRDDGRASAVLNVEEPVVLDADDTVAGGVLVVTEADTLRSE